MPGDGEGLGCACTRLHTCRYQVVQARRATDVSACESMCTVLLCVCVCVCVCVYLRMYMCMCVGSHPTNE